MTADSKEYRSKGSSLITTGYTCVPNELWTAPVSDGLRCLFGYICSLKSDEHPTTKSIFPAIGFSRDKFFRVLKEGKEANMIKQMESPTHSLAYTLVPLPPEEWLFKNGSSLKTRLVSKQDQSENKTRSSLKTRPVPPTNIKGRIKNKNVATSKVPTTLSKSKPKRTKKLEQLTPSQKRQAALWHELVSARKASMPANWTLENFEQGLARAVRLENAHRKKQGSPEITESDIDRVLEYLPNCWYWQQGQKLTPADLHRTNPSGEKYLNVFLEKSGTLKPVKQAPKKLLQDSEYDRGY